MPVKDELARRRYVNRTGCTVHQRLRLAVVLSGPDWSGLSEAGQRAGRRVERQMERAAR